MKILCKSKDGGPNSTVTAHFLIEWKKGFSVALLKFDKGSRDNYHSHAFNAKSIMLSGRLDEYVIGEDEDVLSSYKRFKWKATPRSVTHKVYALETSWVLTFRGPWQNTWTEVTPLGVVITLTHGRKEVGIED